MTGAPERLAASTCARSGAMNSATRMPAAASLRTPPATRSTSRGHVEAAFGGDLGAILRHQAAVLRPHADGDLHHLVGESHLEIHARLQQRPQRVHVAILDVPAVFAQVQRDVVGAGLFGEQRGMHRIRDTARGAPAARVAT